MDTQQGTRLEPDEADFCFFSLKTSEIAEMGDDFRRVAEHSVMDLEGGLNRSLWVEPRKAEEGFLEAIDGLSQRGCWMTWMDEKAAAMVGTIQEKPPT